LRRARQGFGGLGEPLFVNSIRKHSRTVREMLFGRRNWNEPRRSSRDLHAKAIAREILRRREAPIRPIQQPLTSTCVVERPGHCSLFHLIISVKSPTLGTVATLVVGETTNAIMCGPMTKRGL
jgi:hypothetical protein